MAWRKRTLSNALDFLLLVVMLVGATRGLKIELDYEVTDDARTGSFVGNIPADSQLSDVFDSSVLSDLRYRFLTPNDHSALFSLDKKTGILMAARRLDRDVIDICIGKESCVINLDIAITPAEHFRAIHVRVRIVDHNDNAPMFTPSYKKYMVSELTEPAVLFPLEVANDPDSPEYGIDHYELIGGGGKFGLVTETTEGTMDIMLRLNGRLDRERKDVYELVLVAYDRGTPSLSGSVSIEIVILDVNDNSARFDNDTYVIRLREDMAVNKAVLKVHATDPDVGANGEVRYAFSARTTQLLGDVFGIDDETGEIVLRSELDFEDVSSFVLEVVAKDEGIDALPSSAKVFVHVVDVNDNSPQITVPTAMLGVVEMQEHSPLRTFVAHISVTDDDSGDNGKVDCFLGNADFDLVQVYSSEYKVVTASELDRERKETYTMLISCHDHGTPERSSSINITVVITDINDFPPVFSERTYRASLEENSRVDTYVTKVVATDADAALNGEVVYRLDDARDMFTIGRHTGIITAAVEFDREQVQTLEFRVIASDRGPEPNSAAATVIVTITDADDQRPRFNEPKYMLNVSENMPPKSRIGKVSAKDTDLPPHNEFSFYIDTERFTDATFSIDPQTGVIVTEARLDREKKASYTLVVVAKSNSLPHASDRAQVIVKITDRNDNAPVISFPYDGNNTVYLSNRTPKGYVAMQVVAHDSDAGENGALNFMISAGNENGEFVILNDGKILVNRDLLQFESKVFMLDVIVQDNGPTQKMTGTTLNIVVNKSVALPANLLTSPSDPSHSLSKSNTVVIITVVLVLVVIVIMMIVIVCVVKKRKKWPRAAVHYPTMQIVASKAPSETSGGSGVMHEGEVATLTKDVCDVKDPMNDDGEIAYMFSPENTAYRNIGVS